MISLSYRRHRRRPHPILHTFGDVQPIVPSPRRRNSNRNRNIVLVVITTIVAPSFVSYLCGVGGVVVVDAMTVERRSQPPSQSQSPSSSSSQAKTYDLVVVGGGSAGLTAAKFAGGTLKKTVLLIEEGKLGGDCTWTGCVPSKSLLASAAAARASQMARSAAIRGGIEKEGDGVAATTAAATDFDAVRRYFQTNVRRIYERDDTPQVLEGYGIETLVGTAKLTSPTTVRVITTTVPETRGIGIKGSASPSASTASESASTAVHTIVTAREGIILCTGASARRPDKNLIPDNVEYVTYETVWDLQSLPQRLTVVGGGPVGCELAQAFARLGSTVTVIATSATLLPREDPAASNLLRQIFVHDEEINVVSGRLSKVERNVDGSHTAIASSPHDKEDVGVKVVGDVLLLATGRVPNIVGLGLEEIGIPVNETTGGIVVDDRLRTCIKTVYAAGDCTGDRQFTHYAGFQGAIAARNILLPLSDSGVLRDVPAVTFTSPEVASVGYTEVDAKLEFGNDAVMVSSMDLDEVDRAVCDGRTKGFIKVVYKKRGGQILGATIVAPVAGELISEIMVAMKAGMSFPSLSKVIHPYPSYAIALQLMAADAYYEEIGKWRGVYDFLKRLGL